MISYLSVNNFYVKPTLFLSSRHGCWALFSLAKTAASTLKFVLSCFVYLIMLYEELLLKRMISNNITIFVFFICCVVDNIFFVDLYHCLLIWTMLCAHLSQGRIQGGRRDIRPPDRFREGRIPTPEFGIFCSFFQNSFSIACLRDRNPSAKQEIYLSNYNVWKVKNLVFKVFSHYFWLLFESFKSKKIFACGVIFGS